MTTYMNRVLAASVASLILVLFSGMGVSAAAKAPTRRHRTTASRPRSSHPTSAGSSHARHKRGHRTAHKHRTINTIQNSDLVSGETDA
jgi:hypothetical protein